MDQVELALQYGLGALQQFGYWLTELYQASGLDQYQFVFKFNGELLWMLIPASVFLFFYLLLKHPVYFIARKNNVLKLTWRKIGHYYKFSKTAKVLAENEHYGFEPFMDIIIYRSHQGLFSSIEIFCLGQKRFALCVPEKMWQSSNDQLFAILLKPNKKLNTRLLFLNTLVFYMSNIMKSWQQRTFNFINENVKNADLKNFLLISIYIFFLPLVYTRLNLRFYSYTKLMQGLYGDSLAQRLAQEQKTELDEFLNKPITYFFGLIHEKS